MSNFSVDQPLEGILFSFSDLLRANGVVKSSDIARILLSAKRWYLSRRYSRLSSGMPALFYRSRVGVVASATIDAVEPTTSEDLPILNSLGLHRFNTRISLTNIILLDPPVDLSRLVEDLSFIRNKKYWGTSVRFPARTIPIEDYITIVAPSRR